MRAMLVLALAIVGMVAWPAGVQAQPTTFRDCANCPEMVVIPAGSFAMGAPPGEEEREGVPETFRGFSAPQLRVTIGRSFSMGKYEVTRGEYAAFVQATNRATGDSCYAYNSEGKWAQQSGRNWRNPGFAQSDRDPVVCVSWDDAHAYTKWLSSVTGKNYHLPSEAEWEYAARAGSAAARFWGDSREGACFYGNFADLTAASALNWEKTTQLIFFCADGFTYTAPVGSFRANALGVYDMLGNAWEWGGDCWTENLTDALADGVYRGTPAHPGDCSKPVARGGSWDSYPRDARSAFRGRGISGNRFSDLGFRIARPN